MVATHRADIEVIMLGTGTSHGVPMIACDCAVCKSGDPRDRRMRSSIFVRMGAQHILVDTSPELRLQCVTNDVRHLDAVLFTHHHADHVSGLDDLRRFNWLAKRPVPLFGNAKTLEALQQMFSYAFRPPDRTNPTSRPEVDYRVIEDGEAIRLGDEQVTPLPLLHGRLPVLGFRFGKLAYCTDCSEVPSETQAMMQGLDVLILDGLRHTPHPTHFTLAEAIEMAGIIGAKQTYFTHIAHELGHEETNAALPHGMALAFDGQRITASRSGN